jgi:hypothetical protein
VADPYSGREQTRAKHFILKRYLQALAFKVLTFADITYVDGFSGPWETQTEDFADSSFMIAIEVLTDAQQKVLAQTGKRRKIRCFLSENNPRAFTKLTAAVAPFNKPGEDFEIKTFDGDFEDAVRETEYVALRAHARNRANAKARKREDRTGIGDLFAGTEGDVQELSIDEIVEEHKALASDDLLALLEEVGPLKFSRVWALLLEPYMLRVTNVKDICVALAKAGKIKKSWGGSNRKPRDDDLIELVTIKPA